MRAVEDNGAPFNKEVSMRYLTNTFSPAMVEAGASFQGTDIPTLEEVKDHLPGITSAVSHEVTAAVLSSLLSVSIPFNRVNLSLAPGDVVICVIPMFRAQEAREFTFQEISSAGWRAFMVEIRRKS